MKLLIKCLTKSKWSWWWKGAFQTTPYRDWIEHDSSCLNVDSEPLYSRCNFLNEQVFDFSFQISEDIKKQSLNNW